MDCHRFSSRLKIVTRMIVDDIVKGTTASTPWLDKHSQKYYSCPNILLRCIYQNGIGIGLSAAQGLYILRNVTVSGK